MPIPKDDEFFKQAPAGLKLPTATLVHSAPPGRPGGRVEAVGNSSRVMVGELSGRSTIALKAQ